MSSAPSGHVPAATYRVQLGPGLAFDGLARRAAYFDALGVSHLYLSPVFRARPGSPHGYDVVDHGAVSPELGGEPGLVELARVLREHGLGLILDVVPNHMCIAGGENRAWQDVLENGPSSPYAAWFDVDWAPPKPDLAEKVLLPILGDQYGRALENGEIHVALEGGAFVAAYHAHRLPLAPRSWPALLEPALARMRAALSDVSLHVLELESILTAIAHLPLRGETEPERVRERQREKEIVKRRVSALVAGCPEAGPAVEASLEELNGRPGEPRSFDRLEALLDEQAYRLSHWRVASDEINYRRFFDVNELAAIRVERAEVFDAVHALPLRLVREGHVAGLRIDHVDGLFDPAGYLGRLAGVTYLLVEKVLVGDERLRADWPVDGTTGYEFLNLLNGLFVERDGARFLHQAYARLTGAAGGWRDQVYAGKKLVLAASLSAELTVLARRLDRISEQQRFSRDFTLNSLQAALGEIIACFPVYRSYVDASGELTPEDRRHIDSAVRQAIRRNPATSASVFEFIASVLRLEHPPGLDPAQRAERLDFVLRFQQLTGPVTAKGLEDTATYRSFPLASLNEVGGAPYGLGHAPAEFHAACGERQRLWPRALSATSTHDTKRDEDVRARLNVLSEIPQAWEQACHRWRAANAELRTRVDDEEAPDPNAEYLFYQTLVGTWPLAPREGDRPVYVQRLKDYMRKALREAKLHTSWVSPHEAYERALDDFIGAALDPARSAPFLADFEGFVRPLVRPGRLNAAAQALLKISAPGVPDFYQGTELDEFRLVDPDNRQPVDFELRAALLAQLDDDARAGATSVVERLLDEQEHARLKLWATSRALRFRRRNPALFTQGEHVALAPAGERAEHVVAFARAHEAEFAVTAVARFFTRLPAPPLGTAAWGDTTLPMPDGTYRELLGGRELRACGGRLALSEIFARLPLALLERSA